MLPLPIPPFTSHGILPLGIHDCDINEVETIFVYNNQRRSIWTGFTSFLRIVRPIPEFDLVYIDGSFITDKQSPRDVDIVLELADVQTLFTILSTHPHLYDQAYIKSAFLVDLWISFVQVPPNMPDLREFFQYVRPEDAIGRGVAVGSKKGILRISLRQ
ncbi:MAG: hypothetical protein H7Y30_04160 [Pyrinomonadaceae bacterium]|nr:hypothetical protein [Pyrinomonadaceae bacterium]